MKIATATMGLWLQDVILEPLMQQTKKAAQIFLYFQQLILHKSELCMTERIFGALNHVFVSHI
jgi:hypothetical protein